MNDDAALLRRYAERGDEGAFAELVQRHLSLVYGAALRQLDGAAHRAEEVTQSVFTDLARKADSLSRRTELAGWLYTSTHFAAAKLKRTEQRRQLREQEASTMHELLSDAAPEVDWQRLRPVLDNAMHELGDGDRDVILQRFFQGRRFAEVGERLGLSEDAARLRVDRALNKLRALLAKHDITSTSAALATVLANQAVGTVPAGLAASVTGAALSGAAAAGTGVLATLISFMTATKTTVVLGVAAALAVTTAMYQTSQALTATATLAETRLGHAAFATRVTALESEVRATEKEQIDRRAALERRRAEMTAIAAAAKPAPPVDDSNAKFREIYGQLREQDAELPKLRVVYARRQIAESYQTLFTGLGFSPEQTERAIDLLGKPRADSLAEFRATFGEAAGSKLEAFMAERESPGRSIVVDLSARLYFADAPFSPAQADGLTRLINDSSREPPFPQQPNEDPNDYYRRTRNWDRIQTEAATYLSHDQMRGLRAFVAKVRNNELLAAAVHESTIAKP